MNSLLKLRSLLTPQQACEVLNKQFKEDSVNIRDILQFAVDGRLRIAGIIKSRSEVQYLDLITESNFDDIPPGSEVRISRGLSAIPARHVDEIEGGKVLEIVMRGGGAEFVRQQYWKTAGMIVEASNSPLDCIYREIESPFRYLRLVEIREARSGIEKYFPLREVPPSTTLCVLQSHLQEFIRSVSEEPKDLPPSKVANSNQTLGTRERNTLLSLVGVLCQMAKVDLTHCTAAAVEVKHQADLMGIAIGETTIEEKLKQVGDALEARKR